MYAAYEHRLASLGFNVTRASEDTPIVIADTYCSGFSGVPPHVLRCPFSSQVPSYCNHDYDTVLECASSSLWLHPYEAEVRLNSSTYLSTGTLEIFLNGKWANVCGSKFDEGAADSACRQMGYTGATTFSSTSKATTPTTWLTGLSCGSKGHSCLSECFGKEPCEPTSCGNTNYVNVTCTFDVKVANSTTGNYNDCSNYQNTCGQGSGDAISIGIIAAIVIAALFALAVSIIVVAIGTFFAVSAYRKRGYHAVGTN